MKRYKHKKTGKLVDFFPETNTYMIRDNTGTVFSPEFIEETSDWEEVIEDKVYEINSFKNSQYTYTLNKSGEYKANDFSGSWSLEYMLKALHRDSNDLCVHSIRRVYDGEVFTVGDNTNEGIIKDFSLCKDDRIIISFVDGLPRYLDAKGGIHILKVKDLVLKTEDGVDIYEMDDFYYISDEGNVCKTKCLHKGGGDFKRFKTFSTKEGGGRTHTIQ